MALEHTFQIATSLDPKQVLDLLLSTEALQADTDRISEHEARVSCESFGFFLYVRTVHPKSNRILKKAVGIDTDVLVLFRVDSSKDAEVTAQKLLSAVLELLRQEPGDAVLLLTGEFVWLLRRAGQFFLGRRPNLWTSANLALLDVPHSFEEFPVV